MRNHATHLTIELSLPLGRQPLQQSEPGSSTWPIFAATSDLEFACVGVILDVPHVFDVVRVENRRVRRTAHFARL